MDKEALQKRINDQHRNHRHEYFSRIQRSVRQFAHPAILIFRHARRIDRDDELLDVCLQRIKLLARHKDKPEKEVIPMIDDTKQRHRCEHRHRQRNVQLHEHVPRAGTVDERRFLQLLRQVAKKVDRQNNIKHADLRTADKHKRPHAIDQTVRFNGQIKGDESAVKQHDEHENPHEYISAPKMFRRFGQRISHQHNDDKIENRCQDDALHRNEKRTKKLTVVHDLDIGVKVEADRP